jgi:hypothetical protein
MRNSLAAHCLLHVLRNGNFFSVPAAACLPMYVCASTFIAPVTDRQCAVIGIIICLQYND